MILYYIVCNYICGPGEVANATCNGCNLTDICLRDKPCQNGGSCILLSAPDNYICDCSGTGYMGTNCTGKMLLMWMVNVIWQETRAHTVHYFIKLLLLY